MGEWLLGEIGFDARKWKRLASTWQKRRGVSSCYHSAGHPERGKEQAGGAQREPGGQGIKGTPTGPTRTQADREKRRVEEG